MNTELDIQTAREVLDLVVARAQTLHARCSDYRQGTPSWEDAQENFDRANRTMRSLIRAMDHAGLRGERTSCTNVSSL